MRLLNLTQSHGACATAAPQAARVGLKGWSERFGRIFRNQGVTGSNPVSSTEHPGQRDIGASENPPLTHNLPCAAPQACHRIERL